MFTSIVVILLLILWYHAYIQFSKTNSWKWRRLKSAYAWAALGALVGSYFGVAGMGSAIAGTIPGAIIGYIFASNLMKKDMDQ